MSTIDDVAVRAAVSKSTVSRAFSRPGSVRADTRDKILAVARELGYAPSRAARSLAGGRTSSIGLFVADIANPFYPPIIKAVQAQARRGDLSVFVADSDEHTEDERAIAQGMARQVDGLVLATPRMPDDDIREVRELVPTVLISRDLPDEVSAVLPGGDGLDQAVEHLAALGHTAVTYLAGPEASYTNHARRQVLRAAADRHGVRLTEMGPFQPVYESGTRAADVVAARGTSAVIAYNDLVALGLMARLAERGVRVGTDIAVVGIDDTWLAAMARPALTSVRVPATAAGTVAVRMLIELIEHGEPAIPRRHVLPTELIVRDTTGPAPGHEA